MPRKPKTGDNAAQTAQDKPRRTAAQRRADERYSAKNRENQRDNYGNVAARFQRAEKETIAETLHALHVTPAQVIRAAWYALIIDGDTAAERIRNDAETARAAYAERLHHQPAPAPTDTDTTGTTDTTPDDPTTEEQE